MSTDQIQQNAISREKRIVQFLLCIYMIIIIIIALYFLCKLWPHKTDGLTEYQLLILVILSGTLGSVAHASTSLVSYIGNRKFVESWSWWYILRPFIGVSTALIVYFVLKAGFITIGGKAENLSPYGMMAFSALSGMFSKNAIDKLAELFDTLFKMKPGDGDDQRSDKLRK